jgi:putative membrane protein
MYTIFMMKLLVKWATLTVAIYILATYTPAMTIAEPKVAVFAALALGLLNALVRPILKLFAFPITLLTFGLFSLVINGLMLIFVPKFVSGVTINGFWWGVAGAAIISLITSILNRLLLGSEDA